MNTIESMLKLIAGGDILMSTVFDRYGERIGERYQERFEGRWLESFEQLSAVSFRKPELESIDSLRELVYKKVFEITLDPDCAGLVSDDFEMFGRVLLAQLEIPWVNGLWMMYKKGNFPSGDVVPCAGSLRSLL